jgi:hypothetical protein
MNLSRLLPHGITPGELELALVAVLVVALLAVSRHARTIARLAAQAAAAAPAAAAPKSSGGRGKLFLLALAAGGGIWAYVKARHPVAAAKAAPPPAPSPTPRPTITQTVAPHVAAYHFPLTGSQFLIMLGIGAVVAIALGVQALRRSS